MYEHVHTKNLFPGIGNHKARRAKREVNLETTRIPWKPRGFHTSRSHASAQLRACNGEPRRRQLIRHNTYEAQIERASLQQEEVKERAKEMAKYKRSSKMQKKFSNLKLR